MKKKGFMLTDIIAYMALLTIITSSGLVIKKSVDFDEEAKVMMDTFKNTIIGYGIIDTVTGYVKGDTDDCSPNKDTYDDITSIRVKKCAELNLINIESSGDDKDRDLSYFTFLNKYSNSNYGCSLKLDSNDSDKFEALFDCSNLTYNKENIESYIYSYSKKYLQPAFVGYDEKAKDFDTSDGDDYDGIILLKFKK